MGNNFAMPFSFTINDKENQRLAATTNYQTIEFVYVKSFYLPNDKPAQKRSDNPHLI